MKMRWRNGQTGTYSNNLTHTRVRKAGPDKSPMKRIGREFRFRTVSLTYKLEGENNWWFPVSALFFTPRPSIIEMDVTSENIFYVTFKRRYGIRGVDSAKNKNTTGLDQLAKEKGVEEAGKSIQG